MEKLFNEYYGPSNDMKENSPTTKSSEKFFSSV
jgi:hypothetical protein